MFEKEAEEYLIRNLCKTCLTICENNCPHAESEKRAYKDGAEFGYNKANEWHRVSDKLPRMDVFVYLWRKGDDFPVVACRHIFRGHKEWVWYCMWGSGYTMSQLKGKDYLWKEITPPKELEK